MTTREQIARIIDERPFFEDAERRHRACSPHKVEVYRDVALAKADAILALSPPEPTVGQIEAALIEAMNPSPEQAAFLKEGEEGGNIGSILPPSRWFAIGAENAVRKIRAALRAMPLQERGEGE